MIKAGASVIYVQARLGHASVATANEYVTERDAVAEQINRFATEVWCEFTRRIFNMEIYTLAL
ncbi:hypothetical protein J7K50_02945 [bacterium]|nr:hypothetical protein [bacterium]